MYINFACNYFESEKETSNLNIESEKQSKVENIEFLGSGCGFEIYIIVRFIVFFKRNVAKEASSVKIPGKNQTISNLEMKDKLCRLCCVVVFCSSLR